MAGACVVGTFVASERKWAEFFLSHETGEGQTSGAALVYSEGRSPEASSR